MTTLTRITLLALIAVMGAQAQERSTYDSPQLTRLKAIAERSRGYRSEWVVDSVVYIGKGWQAEDGSYHYEGQLDADHVWLEKDDGPDKYISIYEVCQVVHPYIHDARRCPFTWRTYWRICKVCYRMEHIREERKLIPPPTDPFDEALKIVNQLRGNGR